MEATPRNRNAISIALVPQTLDHSAPWPSSARSIGFSRLPRASPLRCSSTPRGRPAMPSPLLYSTVPPAGPPTNSRQTGECELGAWLPPGTRKLMLGSVSPPSTRNVFAPLALSSPSLPWLRPVCCSIVFLASTPLQLRAEYLPVGASRLDPRGACSGSSTRGASYWGWSRLSSQETSGGLSLKLA